MPTSRLSALDASFLAVETANAHMHVGWVAVFDPPAEMPPPTFSDCRDHIAERLSRAPRFRQVLEPAPFGLGSLPSTRTKSVPKGTAGIVIGLLLP